jgi:hypothetical protein
MCQGHVLTRSAKHNNPLENTFSMVSTILQASSSQQLVSPRLDDDHGSHKGGSIDLLAASTLNGAHASKRNL